MEEKLEFLLDTIMLKCRYFVITVIRIFIGIVTACCILIGLCILIYRFRSNGTNITRQQILGHWWILFHLCLANILLYSFIMSLL